MDRTPDVYVFICSDPAVRGLSLDRDGKNLPKLESGSVWMPIVATTLALEHLRRHALDPDLAVLNLRTKGYHVARITAEILEFPHAHRQSA
jgi:hypothetical protein